MSFSPKKCSVAGCNSIARTRGWCNKHYLRWRIHGHLDEPKSPRIGCIVPGCDGKHDSRGMCTRHYVWSRRNGGKIPSVNTPDLRMIGGGLRDHSAAISKIVEPKQPT